MFSFSFSRIAFIFFWYFCAGSSIAANENMISLPSDPSDVKTQNSDGRLSHVHPGTVTYLPKSLLPKGTEKVIDMDSQKVGIQSIGEDSLVRRTNYYMSARNEASVIGNLTSPLASITKSELANYRYVGIVPDGPTRKGPWSMVIRVFKRPDGTLIGLKEFDYVSTKGAVVVANEEVNAKVGTIPAVVKIKSSPNGKSLSKITWATPSKLFDLEVFDNVASNQTYNKAWLIKLAEGIH